MTRRQRHPLLLAVLMGAGIVVVSERPARAQGQGAAATLTGQVTDATGAVVPRVLLTLESVDTAVSVETMSNEVGYYRFSFLRPAAYVLRAQAAGFGTARIENITLQVNQTTNLDIKLDPSTVQEQVTVSASGAVLSTQTSELGGVVAEAPVKQLPLLLRDPTFLVNLVPGVTADHRSQTRGLDRSGLSFQGRLTFSANGGERAQANAMVDGVDITFTHASFNSVPIVPTPDVTQEFQIMTTNYSAEFGRANVVMNIVTKSGTNDYHGSGYWFHQNDNLNANAFFLNRAGIPKTEARRNQFGFTAGGPIIKNKLWVFGDWEKMIQARALTIVTRVPDSRELSGDFGGLFTTAGQPTTIFNPSDTFTDTDGRVKRRPYPNNQIPASQINPFGTKVAGYFGKPNSTGLLGPGGQRTNIANFNLGGASTVTWRRWDIKSDYQLGDNHRFMGRYSPSLLLIPIVDVFNNVASSVSLSNRNDQQPAENAVVSWTWTVSPSFMITQAVNYTWFRDYTPRVPGDSGFNLSSLGGPFNRPEIIAFINKWAGGSAFPAVTATGYAPLGSTLETIIDEPAANYSYQFGLVKSHSQHTFKAGFQLSVRDTNQRASGGSGGAFNFTGQFTNGPDPLLPTANTGNAMADLLLALPRTGSMNTGYTTATRSKYYALYFQDDWRVTNRLTLNLGLRYDVEMPFTDRFNHFSRFDRTAKSPISDRTGPNTGGKTLDQYFQDLVGRPLRGGVAWPGQDGYSRSVDSTDFKDFAPRLGFAYRARDKLVVRGGFAKIYGINPNASTVAALGPPGNGETTPIISTIDGIAPRVTIDNPWPAGLNEPVFQKSGLATALGRAMQGGTANGVATTPYQYGWNIGFQYELPDKSIASLAYAGSVGRRLACPLAYCGDQIPPQNFTVAREKVLQTVANPFFGIITDPTSPLSLPQVQLGQLMKKYPQYISLTMFLPPWKGPNQDDFHNHFESMQFAYKKAAHDVTVQVAYTLSKNLTNVDSFESGFLGPSVGYQNNYDLQGEKSLSAEDVTHRLVTGWVYELPVGRGKRFAAGANNSVNKIVGGWEVSGVMTYSTGFPLGQLFVTPDNTGSFGGSNRSDLIGNPCLSTSRPRGDRIDHWVNDKAFAFPAPFTFGSSPRTLPSCRMDGAKNFDISIIKHITLERLRIEFRTEMFNAFNRPQFMQPNMTYGSGQFGQVTTQENLPRVIQFGLKLHF